MASPTNTTPLFSVQASRDQHILWLQGSDDVLNEDGISKSRGWKGFDGKNGLYCVGLSRKGLYGAGTDAQNIADDINSLLI